MKLAKELESLKYHLGILQDVDCTDSETEEYRKLLSQGLPLPDGILRRNPDISDEFAMFYTIKETSLSKEELSEYLQYKQFKSIITIKNCVVFFTVLTAISLAIGLIVALSLL